MAEILSLLQKYGPAIVLVAAFLEQIGAPVPAIPILIVAGAVAASSGASVLQLLGLAFVGALLADTLWFLLGRRFGYRALGFLCRVSLSPDSCVRQTETFFERWGLASLIFAKFIPGFSIIAPPLAGSLPRASYWRFLLFDSIGALIWAGASLSAGILFRDAIDRLLGALARLGGWALVLLGSALALFVIWKWWERRRFYQFLRTARISVAELRQRMDSGQPPTILDVRTDSQRRRDPRTIPGALAINAAEMDTALSNIDRAGEVVLYCT